MTDQRWETDENGISRIIPQSTPSPENINTSPFHKLEKGKIRIKESFPIFNPNDKRTVDGILFFDISEAGWHIIYCHTMPLNGLIWINQIARPTVRDLKIANSKNIKSPEMKSFQFDSHENMVTGAFNQTNAILDYISYPPTFAQNKFDEYIELIIRKYDQYLLNNPDLNPSKVTQIIETIEDINECEINDFTLDIYTPPHLLMGTINHQYVRPAYGVFNPFNNPEENQFWKTPPKHILKRLSTAITVDLPKYGLITNFDNDVCKRKIQQLAVKYNSGKNHEQSRFIRHRHHQR